jgi:hypothetical protein
MGVIAIDTDIGRIGFMVAHVVSAAYSLAGVTPIGIAAYVNDPARMAETQGMLNTT